MGGGAAGFFGGSIDAADIGADLVGAARRFLDAPGNLPGRHVLLLDRRGDFRDDSVDPGDRAADLLNGPDGAGGGVLDAGDLAGDLLRRAGGLVGEVFDLRRHDREALAGLARTR